VTKIQRVNSSIMQFLEERALLMDGGMGTQIFAKNPSVLDYGSSELDGCVEILNETRSQWICEIHESYFKAGADAVETNTFGCNPIVLGEFGIAHRTFDLNKRAVENAKNVAKSFHTPKFVVASVGPGSKLRTLGHVSYQAMFESYLAQMRGLVAGRPDAILIETTQDLAQIKIAVRAARQIFSDEKVALPIWVQITVETSGSMLLGTDVQAALVAIEALGVEVIGMNCATGPSEMKPHLIHLAQNSPALISCQPNAGLPQNKNGQTFYPLSPDEFADSVIEICAPLGVNVLGGCCGTTPAHIAALAKRITEIKPRKRIHKEERFVTSLYNAVSLTQFPPPLFVGERTNANGSQLFKEKLKAEDFDAMVDVAKSQIREGAHVLDVSVACVSRNEISDMEKFVEKLATQANIPLMIDSTEVSVMERALQTAPGKCIINSINFEDGEHKAKDILSLCKTYGAAVVGLTIDETGMAKTATEKLRIAIRLFDLANSKFGIPPGDIIIDPLTFTLGSGDEAWRDSAKETLDAIHLIKKALPGAKTILGLSNVSFGLHPKARQILNSLMLFHAVNRDLDVAILNASKILPLSKISAEDRELFEALLLNSREKYKDPIKTILTRYSKTAPSLPHATSSTDSSKEQISSPQTSAEEKLKAAIIDGEKSKVEKLIQDALDTHSALHIINNILLEGMKIVGERFGNGEMQLPFVLESAETMKAAIKFVEPHLKKNEGFEKGKIVLATVKGDVHDIGKNLVDIILSNNGFRVVNLGIKQPIEHILAVCENEKPSAIGLSGLLVKSTAIMKENLAEMRNRGMQTPVILGGAALTREFVETDCRAEYQAPVYYAEDAFEGLRIMNSICHYNSDLSNISSQEASANVCIEKIEPENLIVVKRRGNNATPLNNRNQSSWVRHNASLPRVPWFGTKIFHDNLEDLFPFLDEFSLIRSRWGFVQGSKSTAEFDTLLSNKAYPLLKDLKKEILEKKLMLPAAIAGFFPACSGGNGSEILVYDETTTPQMPIEKRNVIARFPMPRQASGHRLCIADFLRHESSGEIDVLGIQVVTMGASASENALQHYTNSEYSRYFYLHGISTELAEAYAELVHKRMRNFLGIGHNDATDTRSLFSQGYQGSRYSFGYPACPDMEANKTLLNLLQAERIGITLSETFQMVPEQSTSALVFWHPQARYFSV
jgi:5-methyltetrahydrofolate--homocysteine methyltransferase